jgi:hypothetical protein
MNAKTIQVGADSAEDGRPTALYCGRTRPVMKREGEGLGGVRVLLGQIPGRNGHHIMKERGDETVFQMYDTRLRLRQDPD